MKLRAKPYIQPFGHSESNSQAAELHKMRVINCLTTKPQMRVCFPLLMMKTCS